MTTGFPLLEAPRTGERERERMAHLFGFVRRPRGRGLDLRRSRFEERPLRRVGRRGAKQDCGILVIFVVVDGGVSRHNVIGSQLFAHRTTL